MATWPPPPGHFREAASGALQPPPLPPDGATYGCFGERFPREAHLPPQRDDEADTAGALRELHASFASSYLELLTAMTTAPAGVYELQLKVQSLEEIITRMQQLLADDARHWEAGEAIVQALRAQTARKAELARALDAASDAAEAQLRELLVPIQTADATSGGPSQAAAADSETLRPEPTSASESTPRSARASAALTAVGRALDAAMSR